LILENDKIAFRRENLQKEVSEMEVTITPLSPPPSIQIVERKGIGHPDVLADSIAEVASIAYSSYCLKNFGTVLHHNFDKVVVRGGLAKSEFGSGTMQAPVMIEINGRCSDCFGNQQIPFQDIIEEAVKRFLARILPHLKPRWVNIEFKTTTFSHSQYWFRPRDITDVPDAFKPHANDTALTIGYWPLSPTEELALKIEKLFYLPNGQPKYSQIGQDIKILIHQTPTNLTIIMCVPLIAQLTHSSQEYQDTIEQIHEDVKNCVLESELGIRKINLFINTADKRKRPESHYLLVTGSCLEAGEEGVVGRANPLQGVIASFRPHSVEAPFGKNPQYHVGKVWGFLAQKVAWYLSQVLNSPVEVQIINRNGDDLLDPYNISIATTQEVSPEEIESEIKKLIEATDYRSELLKGAVIPKVGGWQP